MKNAARHSRHKRLSLVPVVAAAFLLAGCMVREEPLPPAEALARAAREIDTLLEQAPPLEHPPATVLVDRDVADPRQVRFWYTAHPLYSGALSPPGALGTLNRGFEHAELQALFTGEWHHAVQKLTVALAADDLPEMAVVKRGWLEPLIASERLAPLDVLLPTVFIQDLRPQARESCTFHGRLYAVPADGFCWVLFYNANLIEKEPPTTWEALRAAAERLSKGPYAGKSGHFPIGHMPYLLALWSAGGHVVEGRECGLREPAATEALEFLLFLRDDALLAENAMQRVDHGFGMFVQGRAAMTVAPSSYLSRAKDADFPVKAAPVPGKSGPISRLSDDVIVVFAENAEPKRLAIAEVLETLSGPQVLGERAVERGSVPIRASAAEQAGAPAPLEAAYESARFTPLSRVWNGAEAQLHRYLGRAIRWQPGP